MATYRGLDGSVTAATNTVGELKGWTLNTSRDLLEDTAMGDTSKTYKAGLNDWSGTLDCHLDYGDTNGQKVLIDNIIASSASIVALQLLVATGKYFSGTAVITGMQINQDLGNVVAVTFTFQAASALTVSWS